MVTVTITTHWMWDWVETETLILNLSETMPSQCTPRVIGSRKLLPVGHRYRGDVQI